MNVTRPYRQTARAAARERTRGQILDAARAEFSERFYDEVTLAQIAARAGVSQQTVINHFGGKEQLLTAVVEVAAPELEARRYEPEPGDLPALVAAIVDDYEITGDPTIRMLALEGRVAALEPFLAQGREGHRAWCQAMLRAADGTQLALAVTVTDVYTWKLLRRDQGLSREATVDAMLRLVTAVLDDDRRS